MPSQGRMQPESPRTPSAVARALCRGLTWQGMASLAGSLEEQAMDAESDARRAYEARGTAAWQPGAESAALADKGWLLALADACHLEAAMERDLGSAKPMPPPAPLGQGEDGGWTPGTLGAPALAPAAAYAEGLASLPAADQEADLAAARLRWEKVEEQAAASGDLPRLANARAMLRRMGRVD